MSEDIDSRLKFLHLPIIPSEFYFSVLKALKKERKCKVCDPSDVVPIDNYMTSNMNNHPTDRLLISSLRRHRFILPQFGVATLPTKVALKVLSCTCTLTRDIMPLTELSRDAVAVSKK